MTTKGPRGIRNNNPGNIDRTKEKWQGMAEDQSGDPRFIVFKTPEWGIRAMAKTLLTYQNAHKLNTVKKIINRWAPPVENDTSAYVNTIAKAVGVKPTDVIDLDSMEVMLPLVKAMIKHENGVQPYSDAVITTGLRRAGVSDAKPAPLIKSAPFVAQLATGASIVGAVATETAEPIKKAADQLAPFSGAPIVQNIVTALLTIAGICVLIGIVVTWINHRRSKP